MKGFIWAAGVLVALVVLVSQLTYVVGEHEFIVKTQFGRPVQVDREAGLRFKLPSPVQQVNRFDRRFRLYESKLIEHLTKDKKNIIVKCYVCWKISDPEKYFESIGQDERAVQRLEDALISKGGAAIGDFEFEDLFSLDRTVKISDLEKRIQDHIGMQTQDLYGIKIVDVGISQLSLPTQNASSVYNRMKAERKAIANKYRAEGKEKAAVIRAKADREKSEILSKAYEQSQIIMAEGEAQAAQIYSDAYGKAPDFYEFWRSLEAYQKILSNKTTMVLSQDSAIFKYLRENPHDDRIHP